MIEIWNSSKPMTPTLYLNDALPPLVLVVALQLLASFLCLLMAWRSGGKGLSRFSILMPACLVQTFQYFYYCGYVDEVYINLEHSWNLYHFNRYSFSPSHMVDGTVELLYYAILTPFAWSHTSLIHACIGLGLVVSLLHTLIVWYFVRTMPPLIQWIVVIGFAWNPVFAEIQGAGFGNGLVSLIYLLGFVALWENNVHLTTACTVILPLIRPDAVIYSGFLILAQAIKQRKIPFKAIGGTIVSALLFIAIVRLLYGHWILTPVLYKKTPIHEIISGAPTQFIRLIYGLNDAYKLAVCVILAISTLSPFKSITPVVEPGNRLLARTQFLFFFTLYCFYILTNRNFFAETRRYYLPFEFFGFIMVVTEWGLPWLKSILLFTQIPVQSYVKQDHRPVVTIMLVILSIWSMNLAVSRWSNRKNRFSDRTNTTVAWLMNREDAFSVIAKISEKLFPDDWRIATTELQGYGFLMDREIDPLFGYANRRMAQSETLAKRGTKTDVNYLKDSRPEVIWPGLDLPIVYPNDIQPENQPRLISGFQTDFGFNLKDIVNEYPHFFLIEVNSDRGQPVHTLFLLRKGLESRLRDALDKHSFKKVADIPIDTNAIQAWSESHPF